MYCNLSKVTLALYYICSDVGVMYPDGSFIIKGRSEDAIRFKIFGDVVYPGPLEQAASSHPSIQDVAVSYITTIIASIKIGIIRLGVKSLKCLAH